MKSIICTILLLLSCQTAKAIEFINPVTGALVKTDKVSHIKGVVDADMYKDYKRSVESTFLVPGERVILIDSPGGLVGEGNKIIALLKLEKALGTKMTCIVSKNAHSMAFNLLTHCDERIAVVGSRMLVHKVRVQIFFFGVVRAKELKDMARQMDAEDAPFRRDNSKAMGLTLKQYDDYADLETVWTVDALLKRGYLHGVLDALPAR